MFGTHYTSLPATWAFLSLALGPLVVPRHVLGQADLEITPQAIEVTPRIAAPGDPAQLYPVLVEQGKPVRFRATIRNSGNRPARGSYAEIDVNRYPVKENQKPVWVGVAAPLSVAAGKAVTKDFVAGRGQPAQFVPRETGIYIAVVNVDPERAVAEDRSNNVRGIPLQIIPRRKAPSEGEFPYLLPDLVCDQFSQLLALTEEGDQTQHEALQVDKPVLFRVSCRLEGAGPYPGYVEVEVNRRGAEAGAKPLWHGVLAFESLDPGGTASGLARARPEDGLPEFWTPEEPGEYIIAAVADPGAQSKDLDVFLPRGDLIEPPAKDTDFRDGNRDDAAKRYGNNAVFRTITVRP